MTLAPIRYRVTLDPLTHCFHVQGSISVASAGPLRLHLPVWIRGSYLVRDFSKHVQGLRAVFGDETLTIKRIDKHAFDVTAPAAGVVTIDYSVYAFDPSVRKAWLDTRRGFFNGSSLFYCPDGAEAAAFEIEVVAPDPALCPGWKLATALAPVIIDGAGFGRYRADHYEQLIDCPVEMSDYQRVDFDVDGIPHALILSGRCEPDLPRLASDLTKVCHVQRTLFGQMPSATTGFDRYLFLTQVTGNGYGGLEHRTSTALVTARDALPRPGQPQLRKGYRGFLGLCSHEYFHLWNVKRITALAFAESKLAAEAYTEDLWAYEGVTSYYDDLMLLRAGLLDAPAYLDLVAEAATRLQRTPGRLVQTLADASFETWIKYYQPDEQTPNAAVNYYIKGALVSLCLDLTLRLRSTATLDHVMQQLWTRYGQHDQGVPEHGLEQIAQEISGLDLSTELNRWLRATDELPLASLLAEFGVTATLHASRGASDEGGRGEGKAFPATWLGLNLRNGETVVANVLSDSPASRAGLAAGDVLIALDGLKLTAGNWSNRVDGLSLTRAVTLSYFRGDELLSASLMPVAAPDNTWTLTLAEVSGEILSRRQAWLGA
ncbi:MAG: PDZ domain-containing protein [Nevskia sp.]|jgi:predicted metalloprotease with PDZ domain|nr:PDZ domain-containing protein [Nevskia sp.]MCK9384062.1 PDZ domain-containing protein [Nevskia sp.]